MIEVVQLLDFKQIKQAWTDLSIYSGFQQEVARDVWVPHPSLLQHTLGIFLQDKLIGVGGFTSCYYNNVFQAHIGMYKDYRGHINTIPAAKKCINWLFSNVICVMIVAKPLNSLSRKVAESVGFEAGAAGSGEYYLRKSVWENQLESPM